jgi:hypothetical protein
MDFERDESAKWALAVNEAMDKWEELARGTLAQGAARGFAAPPGTDLAKILAAGQEVQNKLAEANGQLYGEQRDRIFQMEDFELKIALEITKLALDLYKADLLNQLALEQAEVDAQVDRWKADIIRKDAETESRQVALIRAKADIEHQVNIYKGQLIDAQYISLEAEVALTNAKLATAEAKLQILDSLYQVIAAEQLVIAAEKRRAAALVKVIEAKEALAETQKTMIPLYLEKAEAREDLAEATTKEAEVKEDLERLGYDRITLKTAQEDQEHQIREAEEDYELAQYAHAKATQAIEMARLQSRRLLQEYSNAVREALLARKAALEKAGIELRLETTLTRHEIDINADIDLMAYEQTLVEAEFDNKVDNLKSVGVDNCKTIADSATQVHESATYTIYSKQVIKGVAGISAPDSGEYSGCKESS